MSWIKMRTELAEDPDVIAIAAAMGEIEVSPEQRVLAMLHRLWSWADAQLADGNAPAVTPVWLDAYIGAPGFAQAMADVGWLEIKEGGVAFPNFDVHMSEGAKTRAVTAKRVAACRRKKRNAPAVTRVTPREEERRVKKNTPYSPPFDSIEFPEGMDTPEVRKAITDWMAYRKTSGKKYQDPAQQLTRLLARFGGAEAFCEAVDHSIAQGYTGCFPPAQGNTRPAAASFPEPGQCKRAK
jgi:hypothetical protein